MFTMKLDLHMIEDFEVVIQLLEKSDKRITSRFTDSHEMTGIHLD